jgi:propionyl-CoA carboxylase alpha chain
MGHEAFRKGDYDTHFVRDHFRPELLQGSDREGQEAAALVAAHLFAERSHRPPAQAVEASSGLSAWKLKRR